MSDPLSTVESYELFLYTLTNQFSSIRASSIALIRRGATLARVVGELRFDHNIRLVVRERIVFDRLPAVIDGYGYEVWKGGEKLYWYDSQPHPNEPSLASTHPHHKHMPPNIKHNRIPAPGLSFRSPNLPLLIREIEELIEATKNAPQSEQQN